MTFTFDPRLFAKATVGPALGLLGAVATWVASGHLDQHSLLYFGAGLLGGIITYFVPNAAPEVAAAEGVIAPAPEETLTGKIESAVTPDPETPAAT